MAEQVAAAGQPARSSAGLHLDTDPGDLVIHLRPTGRPYPPKKRQAAIQRWLAKREETYRFEILSVERIGS
jgi:hypothetical protein